MILMDDKKKQAIKDKVEEILNFGGHGGEPRNVDSDDWDNHKQRWLELLEEDVPSLINELIIEERAHRGLLSAYQRECRESEKYFMGYTAMQSEVEQLRKDRDYYKVHARETYEKNKKAIETIRALEEQCNDLWDFVEKVRKFTDNWEDGILDV